MNASLSTQTNAVMFNAPNTTNNLRTIQVSRGITFFHPPGSHITNAPLNK